MASNFIQNLLNRNATPVLTGGVTYGTDDLVNDNSLSAQEKRQILQNNLQSANNELDRQLRNDLAKKYIGAGLQIGSAFIPVGTGARLGLGVTKALAPKLGAKIAQEVGTGLVSGLASGAIEGIGRGLIEDENPFKTMVQDGAIGTLAGGLGGLTLGNAGKYLARKGALKNPNNAGAYIDDYVSGITNPNKADLRDMRAFNMGGELASGKPEIAYDLADDLQSLQGVGGYNLKLFKSPKISLNMGKAMEQGFYPEEQVRITLSGSTKRGKQLKKLYDENKSYKQNYKVNYIDPNSNVYNELTGNFDSGQPMYFNTKEEAENFAKTVQDPSINLVDEWHHIAGGGKNKLINVNKLKELGFNVDTSTANKEFKYNVGRSKNGKK